MDLNADGRIDIVTGQYHPGLVTWFRGWESGLLPGQPLDQWGDEGSRDTRLPSDDEGSYAYWYYTSPTFGDLDGDGDLDMVVGGGGGLRVSENVGNARIPFFGRREALRDPDGEPLRVRAHTQEELAAAGGEHTGYEYPAVNPAGDFKTQPLLVDWDRDGTLDLLVGDSFGYANSHGVTFFRGVDDRTFEPGVPLLRTEAGAGKWLPGDVPTPFVTDWNADGTPDLLIGVAVPYVDGAFHADHAWQFAYPNGNATPGRAPGRWPPETRERVRARIQADPAAAKLYPPEALWGLTFRGHVYVLLGSEDGTSAPRGRSAASAKTPPRRAPDRGPERADDSVGRHRAVTWRFEPPATLREGEAFDVTVVAQLAPGWHIFTLDAQTMPATSLDVTLPEGLSWSGDWRAPPSNHAGADTGYEGEVRFRRRCAVAAGADAAGLRLRGRASFQACDAHECLPPADVAFSVVLPR